MYENVASETWFDLSTLQMWLSEGQLYIRLWLSGREVGHLECQDYCTTKLYDTEHHLQQSM